MAFNSYTYQANRYAREAADYLRRAREAKATRSRDFDRIPHFVQMARSSARLARIHRQLRQLQRERMGK